MGYPEVPLESPDKFLKIGGGIRPEKTCKDHECYRRDMPRIPKLERRCQSAPAKNFKLENIRTVVEAKPRQPSAKYVDRYKGDCFGLEGSGLHPKFIHQPKFGKVPNYLKRRIHEMQMEDEVARSEELKRQTLVRFVTRDERNELLRVMIYFQFSIRKMKKKKKQTNCQSAINFINFNIFQIRV